MEIQNTGFWENGENSKLDSDAKIMALYLLTSPAANVIGFYHLPMKLITSHTNMTTPKIKSALEKLQDARFAIYDDSTEYIWVINMFKDLTHNIRNPNDKRLKSFVSLAQKTITAQHTFGKEFLRFNRTALTPEASDRILKELSDGEDVLSNVFGVNTPSAGQENGPAQSNDQSQKTLLQLVEEFYTNEFVAAYPRSKEGKKEGIKAMRTVFKEIGFNEESKTAIIEGAKRYSYDCMIQNKETRFIKVPATWLRAHAWNDVYASQEGSVVRQHMDDSDFQQQDRMDLMGQLPESPQPETESQQGQSSTISSNTPKSPVASTSRMMSSMFSGHTQKNPSSQNG